MTTRKILPSQEGYDLYASKYDDKLSYLDSFEKDELIRLLPDIRNKSILDIGSGTGRIIQTLKRKTSSAGANFTAVDISTEMLNIAKKKNPDIDIVHSDMTDLNLEDDTFDIVIAAFVIVHIHPKDLTKAFDEVARVLKPGGTFILTNINQRKAPKLRLNQKEELIIESYYHIPEHITKALENSFFKIEKNIFVKEEKIWINQIIKAII
jgi:ubiquinone/menaquinone biosynthesis C-methylase UbiE